MFDYHRVTDHLTKGDHPKREFTPMVYEWAIHTIAMLDWRLLQEWPSKKLSSAVTNPFPIFLTHTPEIMMDVFGIYTCFGPFRRCLILGGWDILGLSAPIPKKEARTQERLAEKRVRPHGDAVVLGVLWGTWGCPPVLGVSSRSIT